MLSKPLRASLLAAAVVFVAGAYTDTMTLGPDTLANAGGPDIFLARLDSSSGAAQWGRAVSSAGADTPGGLAVDPTAGDLVFVGSFTGVASYPGGTLPTAGGIDACYMRVDPAGSFTLAATWGGTGDDYGYALAVDDLSNVNVVLITTDSLAVGGMPLTSKGGYDSFVMKLEVASGPVWFQQIGDANSQIASGIATDPPGNVITVGWQNGTIDPGGGPISSQGGNDAFIVKYAP